MQPMSRFDTLSEPTEGVGMNDLYSTPDWLDGVRRLYSMPSDPQPGLKRDERRHNSEEPPKVELRLSNSSQVRPPKR